jgi:hypothetical protein
MNIKRKLIYICKSITGTRQKLSQQMKFLTLISVLMLGLPSLGLMAQEQAKIPSGISVALKTGNATELCKYMNPTVDLVLMENEDFYKKNVAETILKDFFNEYHAKDFTIRHQGAKNDAEYAIGNLETEKGNFRVYFLLKKVGQESLIHQIRIEPDSGK